MSDFTLFSVLETTIKLSMMTMIGQYFIFSNTVMRVLSDVENGADVMILINQKILNPLFFGYFFISGVGSLGLFFLSSDWLADAGIIFFIGTVAVTVVFNVPLNNKLKDASEQQKDIIWKEYLSEWVIWNHVRTLSGAVSGVLLCL